MSSHPPTTQVAPEGVSPLTLVAAHTAAHLRELGRVPAALIANTLYPVAAFVLFIVPQRTIAADPVQSLVATGQLAVLGALSGFVFGYGIAVAEERANPWSQYVRTLPVPASAAVGSRFVVAAVLVAASLVPLGLAAFTLSAAGQPFWAGDLGWWRIPAAGVTTLVGGLPFLALAVGIAFSVAPRTALALAQVVVFPLGLVGGLIFPPGLLPGWLDTVSLLTPARAARDATVAVLTDGTVAWWTPLVWLVCLVATGAFAVAAQRRDEGRRFR
ncbi:ABC transporter permease [Propioniciclava soli]|uniref:ABC transporter permease n=1 Tax=Propioniciclava soli TaxID=2775081 RepID=A0ABZ3CBD0_9ACTN